ncbi:hypothetical protein Ciccas_002446 [Cichlidogyrus casuarinus]|uniref:Uncharacterized protein n=1 Tax=Cichlidogyrus casuarinus TaxID=1844966 RepID=A0ABD2QH81_9PLAT
MEAYYNQPWTVLSKGDKYDTQYFVNTEKTEGKPEYLRGTWTEEEKPECIRGIWGEGRRGNWGEDKPEYLRGNWTEEMKPEYLRGTWGESRRGNWTEGKPEYLRGTWTEEEKPEYLRGSWGEEEKPEWISNTWGETRREGKPEHRRCNWTEGKRENLRFNWSEEKPEFFRKFGGEHLKREMENLCGEWEKVCQDLERCQINGEKRMWSCQEGKCCDEEMVNMIKNMIKMLLGAEQSYVQLGYLCLDEKFTLVNISEYFRLCGLRMRWLANGLITRSIRLFNVHEWINTTTFENFFEVPCKDKINTNDYTNVVKTFFQITTEAESRLLEKMQILEQKMVKIDWVNKECRFEGFRWFINFVLPYQMHFVRNLKTHYRNIETCNNGYIFDKCEMRPIVNKVEEMIQHLVKVNATMWEKKTWSGKRF